MSIFEEDGAYEAADLNEEIFLTRAPLDLIESEIQRQFDAPGDNRKMDYVDSFFSKYTYSKAIALDNDSDEDNLEAMHENFLEFMGKVFYEYLHVGFPNLDNMSDDDSEELLHLTYRFFIKNSRKNFINLVLNYSVEHPEEVTGVMTRTEDIVTTRLKREIDNDFDIGMIANLKSIVKYVINEARDMNVEEFLSLCRGDSVSLEQDFVEEKFDQDEITGNFVEPYIDMVVDEIMVDELVSKVRNKILKKYPKRHMKPLAE